MKKTELNTMKKDELLKLARSKKLRVSAAMRKAEIIDLIEKAGKRSAPKAKTRTRAKAKPKAAAARRTTAKAKPKTAAGAKAKRASRPAKATKRATDTKPTKRGAARRTAAVKRTRAAKPPAPPAKKLSGTTIRQKAVASKYYLGAEEAAMPPVESMDVPAGYGIDRIAAMVRDPHWLFSYWEVTPYRYQELMTRFGDDWPHCRMILRVFDVDSDPESYFDIDVGTGARNWYINVEPDRGYRLAIGALGPDGTFVQVAVSNVVRTPRHGMSDVVDDRWMIPDEIFEKIFAASGGHDMQASSEELRALLEKRLLEAISSGAVSSFGSGPIREEEAERGFRLWVATELILYGATEPDARVTVQGKEVKLRGDGTFSLRFALPDGMIDLPVTAVSGDEIEERTIETNVRKKSKEKEPVLR